MMSEFWDIAVFAVLLLGGTANLAAAAWTWPRRARFGPAGDSVIAALVLQAVWCLAVLALGPLNPGTLMGLSLTYLAWLWTLYRLLANDGRDNSVRPIRPVVMALGFVELLQLVLIPVLTGFADLPDAVQLVFDISSTLRLLTCVGALVLVHNLYVGASSSGRETLRLPAAALGVMWLYDLNFYTVAYLSDTIP
jgi:hypothetical protein